MIDPTNLPSTPPHCRRRKRASFTPPKKLRVKPRLSEPPPPPSESSEEVDPPGQQAVPQELLGDLSLWDAETKSYTRPSLEQHKNIFETLERVYPNLHGIDIIFPWLVVELTDHLPPPNKQPFLIAGLVCVFILEGEAFPFGIQDIGYASEGEPATLPQRVKDDLRPYHNAHKETIFHLFGIIPRAEFVSVYPRQLLIELEAMSDAEFESYLITAPRSFGRLVAKYYNGTLLHPAAATVKSDHPGADGDEVELDDTEYLKRENGGRLH